MPLTQAFTDEAGRAYAASHWVLQECYASRTTMSAVFVFGGWASLALKAAGKAPLTPRSVTVTGAAFVAIFGPAAAVNVFAAGEAAALSDPQFAGAVLS